MSHATPDVLSDATAALSFAAQHGHGVRFNHRTGHWLFWCDHHWQRDPDERITRLALDHARSLLRETVELPPSAERRDARLKFALRLERRDGLTNMLALAKAMTPIADSGEG